MAAGAGPSRGVGVHAIDSRLLLTGASRLAGHAGGCGGVVEFACRAKLAGACSAERLCQGGDTIYLVGLDGEQILIDLDGKQRLGPESWSIVTHAQILSYCDAMYR